MAVRDIVQAAAGVGGAEYEISRSLRFNSADSAYLSRTPASAGDRKTWTWSGWVKRSGLGANQNIFGASNGSTTQFYLLINSSDVINILSYISATQLSLITTQVFRDPSSWYHIVLSVDTTQATSSDRVKLYVNGVQVTAFSTATYPSQNYDTPVSTTVPHALGREEFADNQYFNGYLTEIHFVDGQALTPSDFGETDATTGVWKPKAYAGTYGTNGFYLNFSDNSGVTAATLGADSSGNGNNWTPNNFSVTAGAGNDSLVDTPTPYGDDTGVGGEVRGNYCTLNPLSNKSTTISNGNLTVNTGTTGGFRALSTFAIPSSGKWYWECTPTSAGNKTFIGISDYDVIKYVSYFGDNGDKFVDGVRTSYGAALTNNDVIGVAVDVDSGTITFYKNNVSQGAISYSISSYTMFAYFADGTSASGTIYDCNFGQRPFAYTAPSGFKALCTQNLPTPTVVQGDDYFNTVIWTGDGTDPRSLTGVGFSPDMVWAKSRSQAYSHGLYDAVRGAGGDKRLYPDENYPENGISGAEGTVYGSLTSFDSDGFSVDAGTTSNIWFNSNSVTYVAWNWNAGGSNATNTDGTITSTVRANPTAGFSIVSYTGNGSTSPYPTVGHGLGVTPKLIITKTRSTTSNWVVYTTVIDGSLDYLYLNTTAAKANSALPSAPTSTVFQVGGADNNTNGATVIAYCFAEVEGFSKFGSYTGNGSADGPFVYCGFRPAFILTKSTGVQAWWLFDTVRGTYNVVGPVLQPHVATAEATATLIDIVSNGFKLRTTDAAGNSSGVNYIFMAFAENPFKYSLAR